MKLPLEASPSCADEAYNPDWWFPQPPRKRDSDQAKSDIKTAVKAMQICQTCPLFADNSCLEYAFKDADSVSYGIYGGTLPTTRRASLGLGLANHHYDYFNMLRQLARSLGVIEPIIPKRKANLSTLQQEDMS